MAIVIVHGINSDGGGVFRMGEKLARLGYDVRFFRYEKRHFFSYWRKSLMRQDGSGLLHSAAYSPGCDVICHSNGQLVVQSAIEQGATFGKMIVFSGAGTSDKFVFPEDSIEEGHWFANIKDKAVFFGVLVPWHPFGRAGRRGYAGVPDPRQTNHYFSFGKWWQACQQPLELVFD